MSSMDRLTAHKREQAGELFRLARTSIRVGDRDDGRRLLLQAVEYDREHSDAWLWLSATTEDPAEQIKYLEWAVAADPANAQARRGFNTIMLNGVPIDPNGVYRVTVNSFNADGGDQFPVFVEGTNRLGGAVDTDALEAYFLAHSPLTPDPVARITVLP